MDMNEELNPLTIGVLIFITICIFIPFIQNYKYNDHHLNRINSDYCKNLLISTEENSILMTEGGDNQVFGSLYFIYSEKLRPDLTPYDQKGNIFKRIYGDMRYVDQRTIEERMQMVDSGIFNGQEPFYEKIREKSFPYFVPYWQGQRPVYLTWQRPNTWLLGDFYYKRYGIMYKVQNIEYSLVDFLELKKEIPLSEAYDYLSKALKTNISIQKFMGKIQILQKQGFITLNGPRLKFLTNYPAPHSGNYFDHMIIRWNSITNAKYMDFLTREVIINYDYQMGEIYREKIAELQTIRKSENRKEILDEYLL